MNDDNTEKDTKKTAGTSIEEPNTNPTREPSNNDKEKAPSSDRKNKKRGMKPRSKRNRKRARSELHSIENQTYQTHVRPLELDGVTIKSSTGWLRTVEPYPYSFSTFAKARWLGRTVLDVYHTEFGSYPKSYYESAIAQGRILVSDKKVDTSYLIKGGDVLTHTVHRHEPGVAVYSKESPFVKILDETNDVLVVDKPGTLPIHPCGGYHVQSLMNILEPIQGEKLYTIHRLDRLTSGLVILGKTSPVAQEWGESIMNRNCQKLYLARVKGKFPMNASKEDSIARLLLSSSDSNRYPVNGEWPEHNETTTTTDTSKKSRDVTAERKQNAHGFWIVNGRGQVVPNEDVDLTNVFDSKFEEHDWLANADDDDGVGDNSKEEMLWFHLACPTRIAKHKDGVCEAGSFESLDDELYLKGVKPAQTSFGVVRYDATTDSTVVVCKPVTGRTHQIRLHLQHLGHPIANDPNYGGDIWYGNSDGQKVCKLARERMDTIDRDNKADIDQTKNGAAVASPAAEPPAAAATISEPATEQEIEASVSEAVRQETESIHDFIRRTCVWCARQSQQPTGEGSSTSSSNATDRDMLEFLIRSPGIWLHALKYSFTISDGKSVSYRTPLPSWVQF